LGKRIKKLNALVKIWPNELNSKQKEKPFVFIAQGKRENNMARLRLIIISLVSLYFLIGGITSGAGIGDILLMVVGSWVFLCVITHKNFIRFVTRFVMNMFKETEPVLWHMRKGKAIREGAFDMRKPWKKLKPKPYKWGKI
jgi:hypothetical protein